MSWISLAANRYKLKNILQLNLDDSEYQKNRLETIESLVGRTALLANDEKQITREIERANILLEKYDADIKPPNRLILSDIFSLAVIGELSGADHSPIFRSIADAKIYKTAEDQSMQFLAKLITGKEKTPVKRRKKTGHIEKDSQWFKLVKDTHPFDAFDLAVTIDHPLWNILSRFVLPLAFVAAKIADEKKRRENIRKMLAWGEADFQNKRPIVYERTRENPGVEAVLQPEDKNTWRGFDAVELDGEKLNAYYYLGVKWQAPLFFEKLINVYQFFDNVTTDWKLVEENVSPSVWKKISELKDKATYTVVYDSANAFAPKDALERAREHYDLNIEAKDITEA